MHLSVSKIVVAGLLGAIAIFLGVTRLGYIPVPNLSGSATIMHVPVILGAVLQGPLVGVIVGFIFGLSSWLQPVVPPLADPLVSVLPRLFIGPAAFAAFAAFRRRDLTLALGAAAVAGTLTNTVPVLSAAYLRRYLPPEAILPILPQAVAEIVVAVVLVVAIGRAAQRIDLGGSDTRSRGASRARS